MKTIFKLVITCFLLNSCVQETYLKTLILQVDMNGVENIKNPGVRGQFTSPACKTVVPLKDADNDGIYEATIKVEAAQYDLSFKFVNNDSYELEGQKNRMVTLQYKPETITYKAAFNNLKGMQTVESD